jgi:hypothetical protein
MSMGGNMSLDVLRVKSCIGPRYGNHRNFNVGEDIGRGTNDDRGAQDQYEQSEDDERIRPIES